VGKETLRNAVALNSIMFNLPLVLGPALAGEVIAAWGPAPVFVLDAVSYAAPVAAFALIRTRPSACPRPAQGALAQVLAGVRFVGSSAPARALLALLSAAMLFGWSYTSLLPAYADDLLHGDASVYGRLYSTSGLGATLGALWIAGRHGGSPGRRIAVLLSVFSVSLLAMALWPSVPLAFAARTVAGFSMVSFFATANTTLQLSIPDGIRGRVMALWTFTFSLSLPVGQMILGEVARSTSVGTAFAGGACAVFAVNAAVAALRPFRLRGGEGPDGGASEAPGLSGPA
jgi:predicted MFS family arabinose efflux permease